MMANSRSSVRLEWASLDEAGAKYAPVLYAGPRDETHDLVLARLAAEVIARKGRVVWLTHTRNPEPLTFLRRSIRSFELGQVEEWPLGNPTLWGPTLFAQWLVYATGAEGRAHRIAIARAAGRLAGLRLDYDESLAMARDLASEYVAENQSTSLRELTWSGGAHDVPGAGDGLQLLGADLTLMSGSVRDYVRGADALAASLCSLLHSFEESDSAEEVLFILDSVWDGFDARLRALLRGVLGQHASSERGRVLIATEDPGAWEAEMSGLALLERATPLVAPTLAGRWPVSWPKEPEARTSVGVVEPVVMIPAAGGWRWLRVPNQVAEEISGVEVVDVDDGGTP